MPYVRWLQTGDAKATKGYKLPAKICDPHRGPVWHGGDSDEDQLLASCYRSLLEVAASLNVRSIAFPAISTGIYGFPKQRAAKIAVSEVSCIQERHGKSAVRMF